MTDSEEKEPIESEEMPEFEARFFWAFACLMLYKLGDVEMISLERLEQFDAENDCPEVVWIAEKKAWMMKNKKIDRPTIITPPKKVAKQMMKNILKSRRY